MGALKLRPWFAVFAVVIVVAGCSRANAPLIPPAGNSSNHLSANAIVPNNTNGFLILHSFGKVYYQDAFAPYSTLTPVNGKLYGTTLGGGSATMGTVYSMTPQGKVILVHTFRFDGDSPFGSLLAVNGILYGTTYEGGAGSSGIVYRVSLNRRYRVLYEFQGREYDGSNPYSGLIAMNGTFYGTTFRGGQADDGVVFSLSSNGRERVLHSFSGPDGANPIGGVVFANGALYGTTTGGGTYEAGTVFRVSSSGKERVLHSFGGKEDGIIPEDALLDVNGVLYGTTLEGGRSGVGTVFKLSLSGKEKVLHSFDGSITGGCYPTAGLLYVKGLLYGTSSGELQPSSPCSNFGTVYRVTLSGHETTLHAFAGGDGGFDPYAGLAYMGGKLFGTTSLGGAYGGGIAYSLNP